MCMYEWILFNKMGFHYLGSRFHLKIKRLKLLCVYHLINDTQTDPWSVVFCYFLYIL